jgi:hypothetical protein
LFVMTLSINRLLLRFGFGLNHPDTTSNRKGDPARCRAAARIFLDERTD